MYIIKGQVKIRNADIIVNIVSNVWNEQFGWMNKPEGATQFATRENAIYSLTTNHLAFGDAEYEIVEL